MAEIEAIPEAEARYLEHVWADCEDCLGPGAELLDLRPSPADQGVRLVVRYRLGERERESEASAETLLAAHTVLRARILFDRMRFGYSDLIEHR